MLPFLSVLFLTSMEKGKMLHALNIIFEKNFWHVTFLFFPYLWIERKIILQ